MNILKKIIKKFKNEEEAQEKLNDIADKLAIKFVDDITCFGGESFEKWTEDAKKDPSLSAIFEVSEFDKQLKRITNREEVILFLEERKKYDKENSLKSIGDQFNFRVNKEKLGKGDIKYIKNFLKAQGYDKSLPNLEEISVEEKQLFIDKVSKKIELDAEYYAKSSFKYNLKTWELTH